MTAPLRTPLGKSSPSDLRDYKPRLTFNWRCPECKYEWSGGVTTAYHCGVYAVDVEELEDEA
jgi:hypothetical protein